MGLRGPGAGRQRKAAEACQDDSTARPWEALDLTRAGRVLVFLESLRVTKGFGAGELLRLLPFQREWIEAVYADGDDGQREVRTGLLSVARGNGKTVIVAGLTLAHLIGPESEPRGECYSAAATKEQASLIFAEMEAFIMAAPWMAARLNIKRFHKMIEDLESGSIYRALASDGPAAHGLAASFVACDELAQWKRRELFDVLRTSMGKRAAPLLIAIGTQSPKPENIMSELVDYSARVTSGEIEDRGFHGALYAIPDDVDAYDPDNWHLANPALGVFRSAAEMRSEADRARRMPTFEPAFMNLYCNRRVDSEPKAINPAEWEAAGGALDLEKLAGRPCYAGLDLSSTRDLSALVLYFPDDDGAVLPFFWCPKDNLAEREEVDRVPYRTWAKAGHIEPTPGKAIDKRAIAHRLAEIASLYDLRGVAYDRWGFADLAKIFDGEGVRLPLVEWGQGYASMAPAVDAFETALLSGSMRHGMHPVLRWNASNAVFETDPAGNRKPAKNRSIDRIDGLVALIMACGLAARHDAKAATYQGSGVSWA
jgi:phage terminase large subunit-like protein